MTKAAQLKRKDSGTHITFAGPVAFTGVTVRSLPDRVRLVTEFGGTRLSSVLGGDKAKQGDGGPAAELLCSSGQGKRRRGRMWGWVATLDPLTKAGCTLSSLPKTKVEGETAVAIKADHKGRPGRPALPISWSGGDKQSKDRARRDRGGPEGGEGIPVQRSYKEFDGVKLATKQTVLINGKKFTEFTSRAT